MKREIRFRAWDEENKKMFYTQHDYIAVAGMAGKDFSPFVRNMSAGRSLELQQFTGLKDKNGKEIYFGDIMPYSMTRDVDSRKECSYTNTDSKGNKQYKRVELLPCVLMIEGIECYLYNEQYDLKKPMWVLGKKDLENLEVIGNIYESPELLTTHKPIITD